MDIDEPVVCIVRVEVVLSALSLLRAVNRHSSLITEIVVRRADTLQKRLLILLEA